MPRVTIDTSLESLPDGFIEKADKVFQDQLKHPGILFEINTGKSYTFKGDPKVKFLFVTVFKIGQLPEEDLAKLHKVLGEFFIENLPEVPTAHHRLYIAEVEHKTVSVSGQQIIPKNKDNNEKK